LYIQAIDARESFLEEEEDYKKEANHPLRDEIIKRIIKKHQII
jgi:hypothetical protein